MVVGGRREGRKGKGLGLFWGRGFFSAAQFSPSSLSLLSFRSALCYGVQREQVMLRASKGGPSQSFAFSTYSFALNCVAN